MNCTAAGDNFVVTMKPVGQSESNLTHLSDWQANLRGASIVMYWTCGGFQPVDFKGPQCDASLSLEIRSARGKISATPINAFDKTNCEKNDTEAKVSSSVSGIGVAVIRLQLELISPFAAAGEYINTVELNVTST